MSSYGLGQWNKMFTTCLNVKMVNGSRWSKIDGLSRTKSDILIESDFFQKFDPEPDPKRSKTECNPVSNLFVLLIYCSAIILLENSLL